MAKPYAAKAMSDENREHFQVTSLEVKDLWGRQHKRLAFHDRVNILIGRNASGKTTLMNILYYVITADLFRLSEIEFSSVTIKLNSFSSRARRTIHVKRDEDFIAVRLGKSSPVKVPLRIASRDDAYFERHFHRAMRGGGREILDEIRSLVPTAWLPVSRRLSIPDPDDETSYGAQWEHMSRRRRQRSSSLESVDHRLSELSALLHRYRFQIEQTLSSRYKEFEQRVLEIVLFDEERDKFPMPIPSKESLGDASKQLLIRAFESAGLLQPEMRRRIDRHFEVLEDARRSLGKRAKSRPDIFVLPLIPRTGAMIEAARALDEARETLFEPSRRFERIASKFLADKAVHVKPDGSLEISYIDTSETISGLYRLSSGEKQILVLLIQALLEENAPVVYMADEPELSLHIEWQAMLIESLLELGGEIQVIVATHSPDIVSTYRDNVIRLDDVGV